jgi:hypothetical protein
MDKHQILAQIRSTAAANGGRAPGRARFAEETGIAEAQWRGTHWSNWAEAVREAGLVPPAAVAPPDASWVLGRLAGLVRRLGRFPSLAELRAERTADAGFPSGGAFERLGSKLELMDRLRAYCQITEGYDDVPGILDFSQRAARAGGNAEADAPADGYVFLLQSGKHFKFGASDAPGRVAFESEQAAQGAKAVHIIRTDDPPGIAAYWQQRYSDRKTRTDWFVLTAEDVLAVKRRKFM